MTQKEIAIKAVLEFLDRTHREISTREWSDYDGEYSNKIEQHIEIANEFLNDKTSDHYFVGMDNAK